MVITEPAVRSWGFCRRCHPLLGALQHPGEVDTLLLHKPQGLKDLGGGVQVLLAGGRRSPVFAGSEMQHGEFSFHLPEAAR